MPSGTINGQSHSYENIAGGPISVNLLDGQSTLGLTGTASAVYLANIDGQSVLEASGLVADSYQIGRLNGQSVLWLNAMTIQLPDIDGQCTVIAVIRPGGRLSCGNMNGQSRILWRRENKTDPHPPISHEGLDGQSKIVEFTLP